MKSVPLNTPVSRRSAVKAVAALSGLAMFGGLTACANGAGDSVKSLKFWISTSVEQQAGYDQLVAAYEKATGTKVEVVNIPYDGFSTKLRSAAQANDLPDVARVAGIDPLWTKATVNLSDITNNAANNINKALIIADDKGKVTSIPSDVTASGMFINVSLFKKAGVGYPTDPEKTWTWDEFLAATTKVREAAGAKYNLTFDASPSRLRAFQYQLGGNAIQYNNGTFSTNDKTVGIYNYFKKMNDDTIMPKSVWTSGADPNALFKSGQVAAYFSGVWQIADFEKTITNFEWAAVPSPAQPVHATDLNYGGMTVAFDNSSAKAKAAHDFVAWMYAPENYKALAQTNGFLSVETGLNLKYTFKSKAAQDGFALYNKEIELADPLSSSFAEAQVQWALKGKALADDPTKSQMGAFINGQQDAQKTVGNIIAGYQKQAGGE